MVITDFLERNARLYGSEVALVEINPSDERDHAKNWREASLIETSTDAPYRREMTWRQFDKNANRFANLLLSRGVEKGAKVRNSLIADGCVVEGTVENSILFRGVHIEKGAVVKDSIIMQDGLVKSGAELQYCILDKQATVLEGTKMLAPKSYPIVVAKNLTV